MTTVYVNHKLGIVLTDTRTTTTHKNLLGEYETYNDNGLKAIHVHDRIFVESGSCQESSKILRYLTNGEPIKPALKKHKLLSSCFLIDKNWLLHFTIENGVVRKKFHALGNDAWYCGGSGSEFLEPALKNLEIELKALGKNLSVEHVIWEFRKVHKSDPYTNDKINLYRF